MKKILSFLLIICISFSVNVVPLRAENDVSVIVNGEEIGLGGTIVDGTTLIPVRWVSMYMGYTVSWDQETKTVNISSSSKAIAMQIDNTKISVYDVYIDDDGYANYEFSKYVTGNVPPQLIGAVTYIPLRAMAEAFDAEVNWNGETKTVEISAESVNADDVIVYEIWGDDTLTISGNGEVMGEVVAKYYNDNIKGIDVYNENATYGLSDDSVVIGEYAFADWTNITGAGLRYVSSIENGAFSGCTNLKAVAFGYGVSLTRTDILTNIGDYAFMGSGLTGIDIPDTITNIGTGAFMECSDLSEVTIEGSLLKKIADSTFMSCSSLKKVTLPESITSIEGFAFSDCSNLMEINLSDNITSIKEFAFSGCSSLPDLTLPENLTEIGEFAFSSCNSLTEITIPSSVKSIDETAFALCDNLKTVNCVKGSAADNSVLYPVGVEIVYI